MHLPPALVALPVLAIRASAFLIPPFINVDRDASQVDVTVIPEEKPDTSRINSVLVGLPQTVALKCPECLFEGQDDVENTIQLQFEASQGTGLVINGISVLPSAFDAPQPASISAIQISTEDEQATPEQPLDYALERLEPITSTEDDHSMIIPIRFTVLAIGGRPVKTDTVAVHLLKNDKEMHLLRTDLVPFEDTPGAVECADEGWSWCRVKAIVMTRVKGVVEKMSQHRDRVKGGCGRGQFGSMAGSKGMGGWRGGHRPHHHGHGHRHWRAHRFQKVLHKTFRFFVIPALLGVIGGLMASAVGMLVGNILIWLWTTLYRRGQRKTETPRIVAYVQEEDEKEALILGVEELPPTYHDIEAVDEEKQ